MTFAYQLDHETYDFNPQTFILPNKKENERFDAYSELNPKAVFIAKPKSGSQGDSISLCQKLHDLPYSIDKDVVIQRYIDKPLLLKGIKFDLRCYVVVTGLNPIQAYVCDEGLARFCTVAYEKPTKSNFKHSFMHLTNYSVNKTSEDYVRPTEILEPNNDTKRTLTSLYKTLES